MWQNNSWHVKSNWVKIICKAIYDAQNFCAITGFMIWVCIFKPYSCELDYFENEQLLYKWLYIHLAIISALKVNFINNCSLNTKQLIFKLVSHIFSLYLRIVSKYESVEIFWGQKFVFRTPSLYHLRSSLQPKRMHLFLL